MASFEYGFAAIDCHSPMETSAYSANTTTIVDAEEDKLPEEGFEGFFATSYARSEIFNQEITVSSQNAPRWHIAVQIDPLLVDDDD